MTATTRSRATTNRRTPAKPKTSPKPAQPDTVPVFDVEPGEDRPDCYVVGDTFYAVTSDGLLQVPLRFKTRIFREVLAAEGDNLELFFILIDGVGDEEASAQLDELDVFESARIASTYFRAWREKQDATLGEARRSSI